MNTVAIEINNLTKTFKNVLAVKNINFKINKGKIIGLLGPNGCGKSTTIGMLLGLIKPTSGSVIINGKNIENNRTSLLEKMNFISPYIELPKKLTVEENLKVYGRLYGVKNLKEKIYNLMEKLNLTEFRSRKTGELSSGQKNRVSLAKALINKPEILLLDEPTASLDPDVGFIKPNIIPMVVDFPHPFGPRRPIILPLLILKLMFFTAKAFLNCLVKLLISITTSLIYMKLSLIYH